MNDCPGCRTVTRASVAADRQRVEVARLTYRLRSRAEARQLIDYLAGQCDFLGCASPTLIPGASETWRVWAYFSVAILGQSFGTFPNHGQERVSIERRELLALPTLHVRARAA